MKNNARLLKNVIVLGLGSVISKLTVLLMIPLYTASLTPAAFGTVDILINTAVLLLPLVSISAPEAVFRFAAGGYDEGEVLAVGREMLLFGSFLLLLETVFPVFSGTGFCGSMSVLSYLICAVTGSSLSGSRADIRNGCGVQI